MTPMTPMNRPLLLTSLVLTLASCASVGNIEESRLDVKPGGTYYCMSSKLADVDGELLCNWTAKKEEACRYDYRPVHMPKSAVSSPQKGGWCNNGETLVAVTSR